MNLFTTAIIFAVPVHKNTSPQIQTGFYDTTYQFKYLLPTLHAL